MEQEHAASLTARAVKAALPERAILTKDGRATLNSAASMFTLYLASVAHDAAVANKRQTITLKDVLQSLRDMDFDHFVEPIEECLKETKATAALKKSNKAADTTVGGEAAGVDEEAAVGTHDEEEEDEHMESADEPTEMENTEEEGEAEEETKAADEDGESKNSEPPVQADEDEPSVTSPSKTAASAAEEVSTEAMETDA